MKLWRKNQNLTLWYTPPLSAFSTYNTINATTALKFSNIVHGGDTMQSAHALSSYVYGKKRNLTVLWVITTPKGGISIASRIYDDVHPDSNLQVLEYLHVLSSPMRGAFIALVFVWYRDTWRRLRAGEWRVCWRNNVVARYYGWCVCILILICSQKHVTGRRCLNSRYTLYLYD